MGPPRTSRARRRAAAHPRPQRGVHIVNRRSGTPTTNPRVSAGSSLTTPTTTSSPTRGSRANGRAPSSASRTCHRSHGTRTASASPRAGRWREAALNTDSRYYGGSDVGNLGGVVAAAVPAHGQPWSTTLVSRRCPSSGWCPTRDRSRRERESPAPPGVRAVGDGTVEFRVWAPNAADRDVARSTTSSARWSPKPTGLVLDRGPRPLGARYSYSLDDGPPLPDPCSCCAARWSPRPVGGRRSRRLRVDRRGMGGRVDRGPGDLRAPHRHVHRRRNLRVRDPYLSELRDLGVTAVEVMPITTFPGNRGWGYDGVYTSAPHPAYGGPAGSRFVDAAHRAGLAVLLDVVYNHVGPGSEALAAFGPYFTDRYRPSGAARSTTRSAGYGSGRSRTRSPGCASTTSTGCDSTRRTRCSTKRGRTCSRSSRGEYRAATVDAGDLGDETGTSATGGVGTTTRSGPTSSTTRCTSSSPANGTATTRTTAPSPMWARSFARRTGPGGLVVCAQNHDQVGNRALGDRLRGERLAWPPSARSSRPASRCCSWVRSTTIAPLPVLHRPHRSRDRPGHPGRPEAGVRTVCGLRGGGRARSAERRDLSPLEARPGPWRPGPSALLPCPSTRCGGGSRRSRSRR